MYGTYLYVFGCNATSDRNVACNYPRKGQQRAVDHRFCCSETGSCSRWPGSVWPRPESVFCLVFWKESGCSSSGLMGINVTPQEQTQITCSQTVPAITSREPQLLSVPAIYFLGFQFSHWKYTEIKIEVSRNRPWNKATRQWKLFRFKHIWSDIRINILAFVKFSFNVAI